MTKRKSESGRRPPTVLVFGESQHDRRALMWLARGLRPDLAGHLKEVRSPLVLIKGALEANARDNAADIVELVRAECATRKVAAVLAHQDCDALEPAHEQEIAKIQTALKVAGCPCYVVPVVPAWEIEAWWMVFPEAVGSLVRGWRVPDDWQGKDVGKVPKAKEQLARAVHPKGRPIRDRARQYHENDSIEIARQIVEMGLLAQFSNSVRKAHRDKGPPVETRSSSLGDFVGRMVHVPSL